LLSLFLRRFLHYEKDMRKLIACTFLFGCIITRSQTTDTIKEDGWKKIYRAASTKINDLVHTKLDVKFDYAKAYLYGRAWITLHPHFYAYPMLIYRRTLPKLPFLFLAHCKCTQILAHSQPCKELKMPTHCRPPKQTGILS
jgi:hypothetical protein